MSAKPSKSIHEAFTQFFESPTRDRLRALLREHLGELRNCDFKEAWPANSALAKHVLGLGNSGGGCLVVGVREIQGGGLDPAGIESLKDKAALISGVAKFLPVALLNSVDLADFTYSAAEYQTLVGKRFQVLFVGDLPRALPFLSLRDGDGLRSSAVYVRRQASTTEATHEELQGLLDLRIASEPSSLPARDLESHLQELRILYSHIPRHTPGNRGVLGAALDAMQFFPSSPMHTVTALNPRYPAENFEDFVVRMIGQKKTVIEAQLGRAHHESMRRVAQQIDED